MKEIIVESNSYKKTIKSSSILGISQLIAIALTLVRTKLIALFIGTSGYGIFSVYSRLMDFANATCQMGTGVGGVREIAQAKAKNELTEIEKLIFLLRFWIIFISSIAFILIIIFSKQLSLFQFKTEIYANKLIIIGIAIIFANFYNLSISIITGLREIKKIAQTQILGALWGLLLAVPFIYFFRKDGIEWSILVVAIANSLVMIFFLRKLKIRITRVSFIEAKLKFKQIFTVGLSYAIPGVIYSLLFYLTNIYLQQKFDLRTVGVYQACIVLSTISVQTIINAMGTDYLPSLMERKDNNKAFNDRISQQIELGILLSSIGVFAIYIYAPYILQLFYSKEFVFGSSILQWQVLAVFLRVIEYPLGFATTAKNKNLFYMLFQTGYFFLEFGILVLFTHIFGFRGLGFCYLVSYSIFLIFRYVSMKKISQYEFSSLIKKQIIIICCFLGAVFLINFLMHKWIALFLNSIILMLFISWSVMILKTDMHINPKEAINYFISKFSK